MSGSAHLTVLFYIINDILRKDTDVFHVAHENITPHVAIFVGYLTPGAFGAAVRRLSQSTIVFLRLESQ